MDRKRAGTIILVLTAAVAVAVTLAAAILPAAPRAHVYNGTLEGVVVNEKGAPVAGARVTVQQADGRHPHAKLTNASGKFTFTNLLGGMYDIRAYKNGVWSDWERNVVLKAGKTAEVKLRIPAAAAK
jgi:uncharacterized GH25 family protein